LLLRFARRWVAKVFVSNGMTKDIFGGRLLISGLLRNIRSIGGFSIYGSIGTVRLIAKPLQRIPFAVIDLAAGSSIGSAVGVVRPIAGLLPDVASPVIIRAAKALESLSVAAISLTANFLARNLSVSHAGRRGQSGDHHTDEAHVILPILMSTPARIL
jgi:hypothetical protein